MPAEGSPAELVGQPLPPLTLASSTGEDLDLARITAGAAVIYLYPGAETKPARVQDPDGLLGTGCTVQARAFREHTLDFAARRVAVYGLSSLSVAEQQSFSRRERLTFPLLSDPALRLAKALDLPTSSGAGGASLYDRLGLYVRGGVIEWVFHPVPIPRRLARDVLDRLAEHPRGL